MRWSKWSKDQATTRVLPWWCSKLVRSTYGHSYLYFVVGAVLIYEGDFLKTIFLMFVAQWNTADAPFDMLIKAGFKYALHMNGRSSPAQQRSGIVMMLDMSGFSFSHARECTYSNVTKLANCIIFGSPFRIICALVVNSPYVFEKVFAVVKFAIPEFYRNFVSFNRLLMWIYNKTNQFLFLYSRSLWLPMTSQGCIHSFLQTCCPNL